MFEDLLEKVTRIEMLLSQLLELHLHQTNSLTSYKDVANFLNKTTRTIQNYIKDGKLVANEHYYRNSNGKVVFIPQAIIELKNGSTMLTNHFKTDATVSKVMHPIAKKLLRGVA